MLVPDGEPDTVILRVDVTMFVMLYSEPPETSILHPLVGELANNQSSANSVIIAILAALLSSVKTLPVHEPVNCDTGDAISL